MSRLATLRTAKELSDSLHAGAFSAAYLVETTNRRPDVIWPTGDRRAVERKPAAGQAASARGPDSRPGFEDFWEQHYRYYLKVLMAIGATLDDAHDTINDVIVDMLRKNKWDTLGVSPKAWVRKAVVHTYYDQRKRQRLRREAERHLAPESYVDDGPSAWKDWQWVMQMLSALPPAQRTVVELTPTRILLDLAPAAGDEDQARTLARRLDGHPLSLRLVGSYLRSPAAAPHSQLTSGLSARS